MWITRADEPARLRLGDLLRTALVHGELPGATDVVAPLSADDLAWASEHLLHGGELAPRVRSALVARCEAVGALEHADKLADVVLTRLRAELGSLERDLDGRVDLARTGGLLTVQSVSVWLKTGMRG